MDISNRRIVWVTHFLDLFSSVCHPILCMAIFSGPGLFNITGVYIGADRHFINVIYKEVSRVTIYSYWQ